MVGAWWVLSAFVGVCAAHAQPPTATVASHQVTARPLTDRRFERTPARLERGRYLVEGVAHCFQCHSEIDWSPAGKGQPLPGLKGGGRVWGGGRPWLYAPNLSPNRETGAGTWTDDMLARAIREGVGHDGRALTVMPWKRLRVLSDEDLASVIVYLRSIPAVERALPTSSVPEAVRATLKPEPLVSPVPARDLADPIRRGEYLVEIAQCASCHSAHNEQGPVPGMNFGGGMRMREVTTPNLTQDPSGIPYYTEGLFIQVIRTGKVVARELQPIMPWSYFAKMTDQDLKAIFAYLKTVPPVKHRVSNVDPPTPCKLCGGTHGLGDSNLLAVAEGTARQQGER